MRFDVSQTLSCSQHLNVRQYVTCTSKAKHGPITGSDQNLSEPVIGPCFALPCFVFNTLTHFVITFHPLPPRVPATPTRSAVRRRSCTCPPQPGCSNHAVMPSPLSRISAGSRARPDSGDLDNKDSMDVKWKKPQ